MTAVAEQAVRTTACQCDSHVEPRCCDPDDCGPCCPACPTCPRANGADRVTPGGYLIGSPAPDSDDWFALRRTGITATDLPKILGLSDYGNAVSVFHDKRGELPREEAGEAALWGHLLEDVVAQEWARRRHVTVEPVGIIANTQHPWRLAALDRLVPWCPDVSDNLPDPQCRRACALEVKTRSAFVAGRWHDDVPDDVLAQVAWQRLVTGLDHIHVACLIGGQRLIEHRYDRDDALEKYVADAARVVWDDLLSGRVPIAGMDAVMAKVLDLLNPDRSGAADVERDVASRLVRAHHAAAEAKATAERLKDEARALTLAELGAAEVLTYDGAPIFTYREQTKTTISAADLEDNDPELYLQVLEGGHITETTSRVLRLVKRGASNVV